MVISKVNMTLQEWIDTASAIRLNKQKLSDWLEKSDAKQVEKVKLFFARYCTYWAKKLNIPLEELNKDVVVLQQEIDKRIRTAFDQSKLDWLLVVEPKDIIIGKEKMGEDGYNEAIVRALFPLQAGAQLTTERDFLDYLEECPDLVPSVLESGINPEILSSTKVLLTAAARCPHHFQLLLEANFKLSEEALNSMISKWMSNSLQPPPISLLLEKGAQLSTKMLELAAQYSPKDIPFFLEKGVKPSMVTLHLAIQYSPEYVSLLLEKEVELSMMTVLKLAAQYNPELIPLLLEGGRAESLSMEGRLSLRDLFKKKYPQYLSLLPED